MDGLIARAAYAIRALQVFGWPGRRADFDQCIYRARTFLISTKAVTGDDRAMLVRGLFWSGAPKPRLDKAVQDLIEHQRSDGGWGGNDNLPSDAYTTAVSLAALNEAASRLTTIDGFRSPRRP